jgi:hypothetical protein
MRSLGTSSRDSLTHPVIRARLGLSGIAIGSFPHGQQTTVRAVCRSSLLPQTALVSTSACQLFASSSIADVSLRGEPVGRRRADQGRGPLQPLVVVAGHGAHAFGGTYTAPLQKQRAKGAVLKLAAYLLIVLAALSAARLRPCDRRPEKPRS